MAPVVFAEELCVTVAAVADKLVSGVVPPTAPVNVVVPVPPATTSAWAPLSVLLKVTFALFEVIVLVPVKLTGLLKMSGLTPVTVILFPIWIKLALVKLRLVRAAVPPTAPVNVATPPVPALIVTAVAPFNELVKLIFAPAAVPPAFVLSNVGLPLAVTGPVIVMTPPAVVTFPPTLIAVEPV